MLLFEILLLVACIAGAIYFGIKKKTIPMLVCSTVAVVMLFLLISAILLLGGID